MGIIGKIKSVEKLGQIIKPNESEAVMPCDSSDG